MSGVDGCGLAAVPLVGPKLAMLADAMARAGRDATHPNKRCRAVDVQLCKAYQASALSARLSGTSSLFLVCLEGLLQDLGAAASRDEISEMLRVVDILIRGASADVRPVFGNRRLGPFNLIGSGLGRFTEDFNPEFFSKLELSNQRSFQQQQPTKQADRRLSRRQSRC